MRKGGHTYLRGREGKNYEQHGLMGERRGGDRQAGRGKKGKWAGMGDVRLERPDPLGLTRLMVFCALFLKDSAVRLRGRRESSAKQGHQRSHLSTQLGVQKALPRWTLGFERSPFSVAIFSDSWPKPSSAK